MKKMKKGGKKKKREKKRIHILAPTPARTRSRWCAFRVWTLEIFEPKVLEQVVAGKPEEVT